MTDMTTDDETTNSEVPPAADHLPEVGPGDRAFDALNEPDADETGEQVVVLEVHDVRADAFEITDLGLTVADAALDWPPEDNDPIADIYDPDADSVVEVVFTEGLERVWGPEWAAWEFEDLRERARGHEDVTVYHYHGARLSPAERWGIPDEIRENFADLEAERDE